jgi:hypothetical protein
VYLLLALAMAQQMKRRFLQLLCAFPGCLKQREVDLSVITVRTDRTARAAGELVIVIQAGGAGRRRRLEVVCGGGGRLTGARTASRPPAAASPCGPGSWPQVRRCVCSAPGGRRVPRCISSPPRTRSPHASRRASSCSPQRASRPGLSRTLARQTTGAPFWLPPAAQRPQECVP